MPVRDFVRNAADVLLALKPCWAMSPLMVSQLLPPKPYLAGVVQKGEELFHLSRRRGWAWLLTERHSSSLADVALGVLGSRWSKHT
jgi:hypothetical protein